MELLAPSMTPDALESFLARAMTAAAGYGATAVAAEEARLGDRGRVLLRKSGTEPLLRVMAEAETDDECERSVDAIIDAMRTSGHLRGVK